MQTFPENIKFKYSWRKYQQRVLDELQEHLTDKHLHVVAPPGSGKTVLGLEVALRINKPTLILAPTVAIRNQWVQRFCEFFLQTHEVPVWISRDIRKPGFMIVATYQGLHAACNNLQIKESDETETEEESGENTSGRSTNPKLDEIVNGLIAQGTKTIVVDEAHHLQNEWWQTLIRVKEKLDAVVVGLTATPPYDVTVNEWQRYLELNGPVDTEISVPELVIEGDLCPHQDHVFFTLPTETEYADINSFRQGIGKLYQEIKTDETLLKAIENHPAWQKPEEHLEWIYNNLQYYSASLIYLHANSRQVPETHIEVIGDKDFEIPALDYGWMENLLEFYLYKEKEYFAPYEEHRKHIEHKLRRYGAMERKQIKFAYNRKVTGLLTSSISKLNSIKEITDFEFQQLGKALRLVILSDYIRKEFLVNTKENTLELNRMGVMPIFEKLRRANTANIRIGILTGSVIIIPKAAYISFQKNASNYGIQQINSNPLAYDEDYIVINQSEQLKHDIVHIVTQIFQAGEIEVLIGTKSLLGEGWDAPAINSLILASFVGSFVLSNQMRGRAIRTQKNNTDKTGNIWHLVCIDPSAFSGGDDLELLKRRFKSFVGVSQKDNKSIENGIGRLDIPTDISKKEIIEAKNQSTLAFAGNRESLKQRWHDALESGVNLVEEIKFPFRKGENYYKQKRIYFDRTIAYIAGILVSMWLAFGLESLEAFLRSLRNMQSLNDLFIFLSIIGGAGIMAFGGLTYRTLRLYIKYRDIAKDFHQIGEALLRTLIEAKCIHTNLMALKVTSVADDAGAVYCHLEGGTTFEKSLFINTLQEIIGPIDNPRYVIIRKSKLSHIINQKDYHTVPEIIGRSKNLATFFALQWRNYVGDCELVFTRTIEGRKLLLESRVKSLASQFQIEVEHISKWR